MLTTRRDFLVRAAAGSIGAAVIFGLPFLGAAAEETAEKPPPWLGDALAEMKRTGSVGVAIVVPDGEDERKALRAAIAGLLERPSYDVQEHLVEAVYVCVAAKFVEAKKGETAVLLDAEGKRVAGATVDFTTQKSFVDGVGPLLRGEKRLAARAKAASTEEVAREIKRLLGKDDEWNDAYPRLVGMFDRARAAVIQARVDAKNAEAVARLTQVVRAHFNQLTSAARERSVRHLPFGATWQYPPLAADAPDPCPACGMAALCDTSRVLLKLLTSESTAK